MVSLAQEALAKEAYALQEAWRGERDPDRKVAMRAQVSAKLDAAAQLSSILDKFQQRRHVLKEGLVNPRDQHARYVKAKARRRKPSNSSDSPSRRSQS